jgi:hypothetical protein
VRIAFIFYAHRRTEAIARQLALVVKALSPAHDIYLLSFSAVPGSDASELVTEGITHREYGPKDIPADIFGSWINEIDFTQPRGFNEFGPLLFYLQHPGYKYYWFMEYDVRYSGDLRELINELNTSDADLLGGYIDRHSGAGDSWMHWPSLQIPARVSSDEWRRAFLPLCRVSNKLFSTLIDRYKEGWRGHFEALWPTVAAAHGMSYADFGGTGEFVPARWRGKHYFGSMLPNGVFISTYGAWPFYSESSLFEDQLHQNTIWHPVKS